MGEFDPVGTFFLILFCCCGALMVSSLVLLAIFGPRERRAAAERERLKTEQAASDERYKEACATLRASSFPGWSMVERLQVNKRAGLIGLSDDGLSLRFLTWGRKGDGIDDLIDRAYSARQVLGLAIDQPDISRFVTHKEKTPVAVNVRRSAGGRALVGGIVAGPAGAVIGGASGLNGRTKIKMVETERHETVYSKGHPTLIVQLDDLATPRRALVFSDVKTTNEWSSRIHAAMTRARS